ncbi:MAG TPA: peptidylprolyl isomerase [Patescibacteria group bacterium]|nr:peptidylprolyl isomerase [Patescibacteria group bacterium]
MNKAQIAIFVIIVIVFGVLFYITQAGSLGLTTRPKGQISISQIPSQINFITPQAGQQQAQGQSQNQPQQEISQAPAFDQTALESYKTASATAVIRTSKGDITLVLYGQDAPYTVANFIKKAKDGYFNNRVIFRVEDFVIQSGSPTDDSTGGGSMPNELNDKPFVRGAVGMASTQGGGPTQNDSQFFIIKQDSDYLDKQYTNFGMVTDGMDIVDQIEKGDKILGITIE